MKTRIFCFIIATVFLLSAIGIIILTVMNSNPEERQRNNEIYDRIENNKLDQLDNFTPLNNRIAEFSFEDVKESKGQRILENHSIRYNYKIALAQTGDLVIVNGTGIQNAPTVEIGIADITRESWKSILLEMSVGQIRRFFIPYEEIDEYGLDGLIPSDVDAVLEIEIVSFSERDANQDSEIAKSDQEIHEDIRSNELGLLEDFEPLSERVNQFYSEDFKTSTHDSSVKESDLITYNYKIALAQTGELVIINDIDDDQEVSALTGGLKTLPNAWQQIFLNMRIGQIKRTYIPYSLLVDYGLENIIPSDYDIVFETELISISDRPTLSSDLSVPTPIKELDFRDTEVGSGQVLKLDDRIEVNYAGYFADSKEQFDSSSSRQFTLSEGSLIDGWIQGLVGMKVGGTRVLYIPYELAYGREGNSSIPPQSDLIFIVDLINIIKEE